MKEFQIENGRLLRYEPRAAVVQVPEGVTEIGANVFRDLTLIRVSLPQGLRSIGESAFANARRLLSLTLPDSVEQIAPYAFSYSGLSVLRRKETRLRSIRSETSG